MVARAGGRGAIAAATTAATSAAAAAAAAAAAGPESLPKVSAREGHATNHMTV